MNDRGRKWKRFKAAAAVLGVVLLAGAAGVTVHLYRQRKAQEAEIAARQHSLEEPEQFLAENVIEYGGKKYPRNSYVKAILCIGGDRSGLGEKTTTGFGGQSDGLFLLAQDTARNTVKILMIPRDTMTRITLTDLSGNVLGKDVQHLTLAYAYGDGRELSCEYTVEAVSELLGGLTIDHYMAVDTDSISVLNDGVGGVTVTIEEPGLATRDPELKLGETVTLKGKQAETFVRYRDIHQDNTALFRMDRHQQYMEGFFAALKTKAAEDDSILIRLLDSIQDHMVTDMQKDQYLKAALDVLNTQQLGSGDFYTLPGSGVTTARYDEFYVDQEAMIPVILDLFYREIE